MKSAHVINSRGEKENFSARKLYESAKRAGASPALARKISDTLKKEAYSGIRTSDIFKRVKQLLKKEDFKTALKFNLKEGMRKLGPTGFPFEKYIGSVLSSLGFEVKLNLYLPGKCCSYEIDFLARKGKLLYIGECKYRHLKGEKVDSGVALENYARFLDLKGGNQFKNETDLRTIIVTNAKFTTKAKKYSKCVGTELWGWRYPPKKGLEKIIEERKLYPITILPSLTKELVEVFSLKKKMLAQDVLDVDHIKIFTKSKTLEKQLQKLKKEAEILLM